MCRRTVDHFRCSCRREQGTCCRYVAATYGPGEGPGRHRHHHGFTSGDRIDGRRDRAVGIHGLRRPRHRPSGAWADERERGRVDDAVVTPTVSASAAASKSMSFFIEEFLPYVIDRQRAKKEAAEAAEAAIPLVRQLYSRLDAVQLANWPIWAVGAGRPPHVSPLSPAYGRYNATRDKARSSRRRRKEA